jgi:hypothetical protein
LKFRILGKFSNKNVKKLVAINISQKPREEFLNRAESLVAPPPEILPKNG